MEPLSASEEVLLSLFNPDSLFNQHGNAIIRNQMLSDDTKRGFECCWWPGESASAPTLHTSVGTLPQQQETSQGRTRIDTLITTAMQRWCCMGHLKHYFPVRTWCFFFSLRGWNERQEAVSASLYDITKFTEVSFPELCEVTFFCFWEVHFLHRDTHYC